MRLLAFVAAAAVLSAGVAAHADTITQQISISGVNSTYVNSIASVYTSNFNNFDSTRGTLTSIFFTFTGSATAAPGTSGVNFVQFSDFIRGNGHGIQGGQVDKSDLATKSGTVIQFSSSLTDANFFDLAQYTSPNATTATNLLLQFSNPVRNVNLSGSVTYTFDPAATPVAATPEPSSLALLGTGLLGVAGLARRRFV